MRNAKERKGVGWISIVVALLITSHLTPITSFAQTFRHGGCMPDVTESSVADGLPDGSSTAHGAQAPRRLPPINKNWNPEKTYKQAVILMTFSDLGFSIDTPRETYHRIFNEQNYNENLGPGCFVDYFRDQSNGMLNMECDIYGPYQVSSKAQPYENPTEDTHNYGKTQMLEAVKQWIAENPELDYKQYDWNGNGTVNQVIFVYAGFSGNENKASCYGYIWPNTGTLSTTVTAPDGTRISDYTSSAELWSNNKSCGIGTICHEFTHSLGLPDIYPTNGVAYSTVDEWDLMDGGNFTNYGWCPPNYTPLEKMLLGWLTPTELTEPTTVSNLATVDNGGVVFLVKNTTNEYYLLENRQWQGWDAGLPGKGLVVYHVNYNASSWGNNSVNNKRNAYRFHLIAADNRDYDSWYDYIKGSGLSQYANKNRMNSRVFSDAPYPFVTETDSLINELTDTSVPAAIVYNVNADGTLFMGKAITDIKQNEDGTVSFLFMGGIPSDVHVSVFGIQNSELREGIFDLQGRRIYGTPSRGLVIKNGRKMMVR